MKSRTNRGRASRPAKPIKRARGTTRLKVGRARSSAKSRKTPPKSPVPNRERDRTEILAVSKRWWDANRQFSIPLMREAFVGSDKFHGFNLNGHTYYGIDEWVKLWEYLAHVMEPAGDSAAVAEPRNARLLLRDDMAVLTAESALTVRILPTSDAQSALLPRPGETARIAFRSTEVFLREDHEGKPVWKMWHFHCSAQAPEGEQRMGF